MLSSSLAFVFPGQGSQFVGMLADCADNNLINHYYTLAGEVLGYDLWQLTQQGPEAVLNETDKTQPAILTASVALYRLWQKHDHDQPQLIAGHSLGEYSALVIAGVIDFVDAIRLVQLRGSLMLKAVPPGKGAMAAIIGLSDQDVEAICCDINHNPGQFVSIANYNSPGQVVIGGYLDSVEQAMNLAKQSQAKLVVKLPVSIPSHTKLMDTITDDFAEALDKIPFAKPQIPVLQNASFAIANDPENIKKYLVSQLIKPVNWTKTIELLVEQGIKQIAECGPGKVLTGLNKRISAKIDCLTFNSYKSINLVNTNNHM